MPFFAAQVEESGTPFGPEHHVKDFDGFHAEIEHNEGDCATLKLEVRNPRRGLLSGRRWLWLSWYSKDDPLTVYPLFFGRIVGIPTNILDETCTIEFDARPEDFVARKHYLANTLRELPWYDEVFVDEKRRVDADPVLETRSARWHVDRLTHEVTVSDVLDGEDGIEEFTDGSDTAHDLFDLSLSVGQAPLSRVRIEAGVPWKQAAQAGTIKITDRVWFTYTGQEIVNNWPKVGASIGGGWTVAVGTKCQDVYGVGVAEVVSFSDSWSNKEKEHLNGDPLSVSKSASYPDTIAPMLTYLLEWFNDGGVVDPYSDPPTNRPAKSSSKTLYVPLWNIHSVLFLTYTMGNNRIERLSFDVKANLQPIVTLTTDDFGNPQDEEVITINGANVGLPIGSEIPIGDTVRRSYFETDRGKLSLEYLILLGRARLREKSRCVSITFSCRFERAINLSCRKNARIRSDRLPGGEALGKIVSYKIVADGDTGFFIGNVTMLCAPGYGQIVESVVGVPRVFEEGVVEPGVQKYDFFLTAIGQDIGYTIGDAVPNDDGLVWPLTRDQVVVEELVAGNPDDQASRIDAQIPFNMLQGATLEQVREASKQIPQTVSAALAEAPALYQLRLKAVSGLTFTGTLPVATVPLEVPMMINLEAYPQ